MRTFISAKLHGLRVTECRLDYHGSITIDKRLLDLADIKPFEQVHVLNVNNGSRLITYAFEGGPGVCCLNGAAARHAQVGDTVLVLTYRQEEQFSGAKVFMIDPDSNTVREALRYAASA